MLVHMNPPLCIAPSIYQAGGAGQKVTGRRVAPRGGWFHAIGRSACLQDIFWWDQIPIVVFIAG
jgi:hypothetical protein